jgi:hypothetical protein
LDTLAPTTANSEPAPAYGVSGRDHVAGELAKADENTHEKVAGDIRVLEDQAVECVYSLYTQKCFHITNHLCSFGSDIVIIIVGEASRIQSFILHADFLTARSAYFKSALLRSPTRNIFNFPKHDPRAFALYFQLIYTGRLPSKPSSTINSTEEYTLLCNLYILARKFTDVHAQNAALDAIHAKATEIQPLSDTKTTLPTREHVTTIYNDIDGPCAGRRLMVDLYASQAMEEDFTDDMEDWPAVFMGGLALRLTTVCHQDRIAAGLLKWKEDYHEVKI